MNDQSFLHSVGQDHPEGSQKPGRDGDQAMSGQVRKRFRRGVALRPTGTDVVAQVPGAALAPYRANDPILDEWDALPLVPPGVRRHFLSGAPLVNYFRRDPAAKAFDLLRTRLLQALRANGWSRIAIASPTSGCGTTFTAVNLAQSLARVPGSRTVLMDLNHRNPGIASMLEMDDAGDMGGYLAGEVPLTQHLKRASRTLALGLTAGPALNAAEILHDARCGETLDHMAEALHPGVVIYDLPAILAHDDLAAFLPQVDGVLLVADGTQTQARHIAACERILEGQTQVLGIILNRARKPVSKEFEF
jgi:protein-tyrosine kinase